MDQKGSVVTNIRSDLTALVDQIASVLAVPFRAMDVVEDEIDRATREFPAHSDLLYHGFALLEPTHALMGTEQLLRAHCRELLTRLVNGTDTRPGTAAEVCCLCHDISLNTPLSSPAAGLYMRMWSAAGLPGEAFDAERSAHHEGLEADRIDALEARARRMLAVPDRHLGATACDGRHHGQPVLCRFNDPDCG